MPRDTPFAAAGTQQQQQQQQQAYYTLTPHFPGRRPSPFQEAAAVLQLAGSTPDGGRAAYSNSWAVQPQHQHHHHYLDVFEPLDAAARADTLSSSSSSAAGRHGYQAFYVRSNNTMHVLTLESGGSSASHMSHAARHNSILQLRTQALMRSASSDGGSSSSSAANAASGVERASRARSSSSTGGAAGSPMRRLQRRSHSLLAATSATATQVWASITDRSRSLLCISDPGGSSRSSSGRRSSGVDGADVAAAAADAVAGAGTTGSTARVTRLSARMLTRSTSIHRSHARSAAVLIDVDATTESSYDDLVALDQFSVKRACRSSVLAALPCRLPCAEDAAQQRQCHICFEAWASLPQTSHRSADTCSSRGVGQVCCSSCGLPTPRHQHNQQQQPQHRSPWSSPVALAPAAAAPLLPRPQGRLVPAPAAAELLLPASEALAVDECDTEAAPGGGGGSSAPSSEYADARSSTGSAEFVDALEVPAPDQGPLRPLSFDAWITRVAAAGDGGSARRPGLHGSQLVVLAAGYGRAASAPHAGDSAHACCRCRPPAQQAVQQLQQGLVAAAPKALIRKLPCGHEFCCGCIRTWLKEHHTCPVCRWAFPERDTRLINK